MDEMRQVPNRVCQAQVLSRVNKECDAIGHGADEFQAVYGLTGINGIFNLTCSSRKSDALLMQQFIFPT